MLLVRNDVNLNIVDTECARTLLFCAAANGLEGLAGTLLERNDVNPNTADTDYSQTLLSLATENGHRGS